ncbi:GntR family transcriptional regulator [Halopseudomonas sp.]|uniref:GntR family transcriptional regulator n=1 Tax=Halopseudomonas sp. TaxID=2901191 RepID=UPI0030029658
MAQPQAASLADQVYRRLKQDIFEFVLLPHDRFSENQIAERYQVSRTPVRDALYRLEREGYLEVGFRRGWSVKPLDFARIDELYEVRITLECAALEKLCAAVDLRELLAPLCKLWLVPEAERETAMQVMAELDEAFHCELVRLAGNGEMTRMHQEVCERIRIVRRLDFYKSHRIAQTYEEHADILRALLSRRRDESLRMLRAHIEQSRQEVHKISLSMLEAARRTYRGG